MSLSDEQCVEACLDDHPEAFRYLVERYQTPLMRWLLSRLHDRDQAEEAAQEAFVRAYFALRRLQKPAAFFSWLFGIADRVAKETRRDAQHTRRVDWQQLEEDSLADKHRSDPESPLMDAVEMLPEAYREVVILRFHGQQSCQDISRHLNVPLGTVTKRLSRAYALLREQLNSDAPVSEKEVQG